MLAANLPSPKGLLTVEGQSLLPASSSNIHGVLQLPPHLMSLLARAHWCFVPQLPLAAECGVKQSDLCHPALLCSPAAEVHRQMSVWASPIGFLCSAPSHPGDLLLFINLSYSSSY